MPQVAARAGRAARPGLRRPSIARAKAEQRHRFRAKHRLHRRRGTLGALFEHERCHLARFRTRSQIGAQRAEQRFGLAPVKRDRVGAERAGDDRELAVVFVLLVPGHVGADVAQIGGKEAGGAGDMDPGEHARIARRIGRAVGQRARDRGVDAVHPFDRRGRVIAVAEGRHRDEARGPSQPPVHVGAEVRMVEHPLQGVRMEHLEQQRTDPAHHHRDDIGVDHPDGRIAREQRRVGYGHGRFARAGIVERRAHLAGEPLPQGFDRIAGRHEGNIGLARFAESLRRRAR
jgi:hypothetical protein